MIFFSSLFEGLKKKKRETQIKQENNKMSSYGYSMKDLSKRLFVFLQTSLRSFLFPRLWRSKDGFSSLLLQNGFPVVLAESGSYDNWLKPQEETVNSNGKKSSFWAVAGWELTGKQEESTQKCEFILSIILQEWEPLTKISLSSWKILREFVPKF